MKTHDIGIAVCATSCQSVIPLFKHACAIHNVNFNNGLNEIVTGRGFIRYISFDQLVNDKHSDIGLLLIDEAAGFSLYQLKTLLHNFPRIVFSTTVHGYEGSGRGFLYKFDSMLRDNTRGVRHGELDSPVRWPDGDPLESLINRLLLLDNDELISAVVRNDVNELKLTTIDQDELLSNELLLQEIYGLMKDAHYRTKPSDLRHILDGVNLEIIIAQRNTVVVGLLICVVEGGFDLEKAKRIAHGYSRPRGHLIAETFAAHLGSVRGAQLIGKRIMRIAVKDSCRRQSIATRLVNYMLENSAVDYVASSFAIDESVCLFWHSMEFDPIRVGNLHNRVSGSRSLIVMKAISSAGCALQQYATERFYKILQLNLSAALRSLPLQDCLSVIAMIHHHVNQRDWDVAHEFAITSRNIESALPELQNVLISRIDKKSLCHCELQFHCKILVYRLLQQYSEADCVKKFNLQGKSELNSRVRHAMGVLLLAG